MKKRIVSADADAKAIGLSVAAIMIIVLLRFGPEAGGFLVRMFR